MKSTLIKNLQGKMCLFTFAKLKLAPIVMSVWYKRHQEPHFQLRDILQWYNCMIHPTGFNGFACIVESVVCRHHFVQCYKPSQKNHWDNRNPVNPKMLKGIPNSHRFRGIIRNHTRTDCQVFVNGEPEQKRKKTLLKTQHGSSAGSLYNWLFFFQHCCW